MKIQSVENFILTLNIGKHFFFEISKFNLLCKNKIYKLQPNILQKSVRCFLSANVKTKGKRVNPIKLCSNTFSRRSNCNDFSTHFQMT